MMPYNKDANGVLGCIRKSTADSSKEAILSLYSVLAKHIWSALSCSGLPGEKKIPA